MLDLCREEAGEEWVTEAQIATGRERRNTISIVFTANGDLANAVALVLIAFLFLFLAAGLFALLGCTAERCGDCGGHRGASQRGQ
jgi:hypothetical protein